MKRAELIARLESLEGSDRVADCEIAWATGWDRQGYVGGTWRNAYPHWRGDEGRTNIAANNWKVPTVTASLDAAIALVERVLGEDAALEILAEVAAEASEDTVTGAIHALPRLVLIAALRALDPAS